jgi:Ca2+-binding RTX toxin-like protein
LPNHVEHLTLIGNAAIDGTGNERDNLLRGNHAPNTLAGGAGDDTYFVSTGDTVTERSGQGIDTVYADVSWTLAKNVENLFLTGTADLDATGNALANELTGNSGNNWLDGNGGADTMGGGLGDDTYVVSQTGDIVIENAAEGIDTVRSSIGCTLGENLEHLTLTGARAINATGNALDNVLVGNSARNKLTGGAGDDRLDGAAGTDTLVGGAGNDTYLLGLGYGTDTIVENDTTPGNSDSAIVLDGVATDQIWFRRVGNNLEASVIGTSDAFVLRDWYRGAAFRVERFRTTDGDKTLQETNVQALVDGMAAFAPPAPGTTTLPLDYQATLSPLIAANWQ